MQDADTSPDPRGRTTWDRLAEELQALRRRAGDPSYAEIARLVAERRVAAGMPPHAVRVARTTIYDVFRTGRSRINLRLVREIALVLGAEDAEVDRWIAESRPPAGAAAEEQAPPVPSPAPAPAPTPAPAGQRLGPTLALVLACVGVNVLGRLFVDAFDLPIFLDMIGTAVAAIALGPWLGAAVGAATNVAGVVSSGPASLAFVAVNVAGALVWGYGVRRFGMGRTLPRFLTLNLLVAAACSLVAVPILLAMFGGTTGHGQDVIADTYLDLTHLPAVAVAASNLLVSVGDKMICGFLALVALSAVPGATGLAARRLLPLPPPPPEPPSR